MFRSKHYSTTSSVADSIISHHINEHSEILNEAHDKETREFLESFNSKKEPDSEGSEYSQDENEE